MENMIREMWNEMWNKLNVGNVNTYNTLEKDDCPVGNIG